MKNSKKIVLIALTLTTLLGAAGCSSKSSSSSSSQASKPKEVTVKVGTTSDEPRVWEAIEKKLAKDNIKIKIVNFQNGANPNQALNDGEIDLNAFQHYAYLNKNIKDLKLDITAIGETIIVPLNLYSKKVKNVSDLKSGAKIAVPNDATNEGRALHVLENAGLIKLKDSKNLTPGLKDIAENKLDIKFVELVGAQIPRSLNDVDAAIINAGYAVDSGLDPIKDPIYKDKIDLTNENQKPYINVIVARTKDKDNATYKKIVKAYQSEEIAKVIKTIYKASAIPAWDKKYAEEWSK